MIHLSSSKNFYKSINYYIILLNTVTNIIIHGYSNDTLHWPYNCDCKSCIPVICGVLELTKCFYWTRCKENLLTLCSLIHVLPTNTVVLPSFNMKLEDFLNTNAAYDSFFLSVVYWGRLSSDIFKHNGLYFEIYKD